MTLKCYVLYKFIGILFISVVNAKNVAPGEYPYMIVLRYAKTSLERCTGILISSSWVLTTAECIKGYPTDELNIQHGVAKTSPSQNVVNIVEIIDHPKYSNAENNIGIFKLEKNIEFNELTHPAKLPPKNYIAPVGSKGFSIGWHSTDGGKRIDHLQVYNVTILEDDECTKEWKSKTQPTEICGHNLAEIGPPGICKFGVGSALISNRYMYAVQSIGGAPCGSNRNPSKYTEIIPYYDWIFETIVNYEFRNFLKAAEWKDKGQKKTYSEILENFTSGLRKQVPKI